ncbi:MAG: pyridoxamine 5'-phosphate oxidase family protein, partial [Candidatus Thorarchaeota archaeon]
MSTDLDTKMRINNLLESQLFCVLTTNLKDSNFPYSSLIAFFHTPDLKHIYFATSRKTTKFANLLSDPKVCIFFDNRSNELEDVIETVSATVLGKVEELNKEREIELISQFIDKYPQLKDFVQNIDTA